MRLLEALDSDMMLCFMRSYVPNRTREYDICRMMEALMPVYMLLKPDWVMESRRVENVDGFVLLVAVWIVCIRLRIKEARVQC